ncbi:GumC family protein [Novispirillum sp. DQ9]|uniref:GumC family protein n=1 Tax=Novispirillum sp. DQ9 TaxID=3398612 RepID=UPI003C7ACEC0
MSSDRDLFSTPPSLQQHDFARSARRAWRIIWRGKFLILACAILALAPTVALLKQVPKQYTAEAVIMVQAAETNDVLTDRSGGATGYRLTEDVMQTEAELITSSMLARRVVDKLQLQNDPEFNAKLRTPRLLSRVLAAVNPLTWMRADSPDREGGESEGLSAAALEDIEAARIVRAFQGKLTVRPKRRTFVISVRFSSESREKAALIANTVAELYVLDRLEASFTEARQVAGWLGERLESLQKDALAAENAVEQFRSQNDLRPSTGQATISDQQLSELNSRLVIARADLAQKQARRQQAGVLGQARGSVDTSSDVLQSPLIQRLRELEAQKSRELSEATKTYADRHPHIVGLRADLADLRNKISQEIGKIAASMSNDVEVALAGVRTLENELAQLQKRTNVAGETTVRLRDLERQAEASRSLYETFLTRFKREAEQANMRRANARIVSTATIPTQPSSPATLKIIGAVTLMSLFLGLVLVFILDKLDHTLRSADDAEDVTGLPVLALIPGQASARRDRALGEMRADKNTALASAVRSLRTALLVGEETAPCHTVLVTSSVPKEGKTFVSLYLASTFAKLDQKVLLIDSDVFRPCLHTALNASGERGLVQVLNGQLSLDQAIQRNALGTLDFLAAGQGAQVSDLLQSQKLEALLAELSKTYSRIIIDSPPVLAVADVRILARLADRVIYLTKWGSTPRDGVRNGIKLLRSSGANLTGVVLSQVDQRKHASYGYGDYGQYYGRYAEYYGK